MKRLKPTVADDRFNIADTSIYIVCGLIPKDAQIIASLNGKEITAQKSKCTRFFTYDRAELRSRDDVETVDVRVTLPNPLPDSGTLNIYAQKDNQKVKWLSRSVKYLKKKGKNPQAFIEQINRRSPSEFDVVGWAVSDQPVEIEAYAPDGSSVEKKVVRTKRTDLKGVFSECEIPEDCGFQIAFKDILLPHIKLVFKNKNGEDSVTIPVGKAEVLSEKISRSAVKGMAYLKKYGFAEFAKKAAGKIAKSDKPVTYGEWIRHNFPSRKQLDEQRSAKFDKMPLISIVVPLYKTKKNFLEAIVNSVKAQTYSNWELLLSDGSGKPSPIEKILNKMAAADKRIRIIPADTPRRIVQNTNVAIEQARGEYIAFADHDDVLAPDALYEVVKAINEHDEPDMIYTDEDKVDESGTLFFDPSMKPDFNIDFLRTVNYICHLCVMSRSLLDKIGYLNEDYEGSQDYDIILRATENTDKIYHIPKVLYHWRSHSESTSINPESKSYAFVAGRRAIQAHFDRLGIKAEVTDGEWDGLYRTRYIRSYDPLISIIIPNKDHTDDLDRCIRSILEKSTYTNYEIIVAENNSDKPETFEYYKKIEAEEPKVKVIYYKDKFNYSKINNFGVENAKGEYLLLLNNDTSIINGDCIEELLGYCMRDDVGAVGARLFYEDDTIQHAGVVIGFGGIAGHCFVNQKRNVTGYRHRIICAQDYSAVTAACMMVDRKVYEKVGGFSEELAVAFNDVDFCLKVRKAGYLVVYNPYAELYHYESKSRGYEDTPEKVNRFNSEINEIQSRWFEILENGDPYYSPNLTLISQDFQLRKNW